MKLWNDFFDYVLPELPGCPQDVAALAIRNTTIDFFGSTGVYVVSHEAIDVVAGVGTYRFAPPAGWDVAQVKNAWHKGQKIHPSGSDDLEKLHGEWTKVTGNPKRFMHEDQSSVRVVPLPVEGVVGGLTMRVALRPTRSSAGFSTDWVFDTYVETIAAGAKSALMIMPAKPWSNPQLAAFYAAKYKQGVGSATIDGQRALTRGATRVQMKPAA